MMQPRESKTFVCFGKTGSGKSTFVKAMGGDVPEDELEDINGEAVTEEAEFYAINDGKDYLMDTPGFGDTRSDGVKFTNAVHKKCILEAFNRNKKTHFNGVFWFVTSGRAEAELHEEARFIQELGEFLESGSIWDHVLVMLRYRTPATGVRRAIECLQSEQPSSSDVRILSIGLKEDDYDPGSRCEVVISKNGLAISMEVGTKAFIMDFVFQKSPIKVSSVDSTTFRLQH